MGLWNQEGVLIIISGIYWAPDSSRIAYIADQEVDDRWEAYTSFPTTSTGNVKVSGDLVSGGDVLGVYWAPDSSRIAYVADQDTDEIDELYTSLPDGSNIVKVNGTLVAGRNVEDLSWAPDSSRIAYRADQDINLYF